MCAGGDVRVIVTQEERGLISSTFQATQINRSSSLSISAVTPRDSHAPYVDRMQASILPVYSCQYTTSILASILPVSLPVYYQYPCQYTTSILASILPVSLPVYYQYPCQYTTSILASILPVSLPVYYQYPCQYTTSILANILLVYHQYTANITLS